MNRSGWKLVGDLLFALVWALVATSASADSPGWRGDGTGRYPGAEPPTQWDVDDRTNVLWQAKVGKGHSTPVVVGDRVFVTADRDLLVCLDRRSGKTLWSKDNGFASLPEGMRVPEKRPPTSPNCGYSSATPVADGRAVYACYGTGIVVSFHLDGTRRWVRYLDLPQASQYGRSASPVLGGGKLLVSLGGLTALDAARGTTVWENLEAKPAFGTPAVAQINDLAVVVTPTGDCVRLSDGRILARGLGDAKYSSPIVQGDVVYYADSPTVAVRLSAGAGGQFRAEPLWRNEDVEGEVFASPVWWEGLLYCAGNDGVFYVIEPQSGKTLLKKELPIASTGGKPGTEAANVYPSLTLAGKHLLVGNDRGEMLLLAPGRQFRQIACNYLDKGSGASPVPDGHLLLLRGGENLYGIGRK